MGKTFFDQPVKSDMGPCNNIRKTVTGQADDYTTGCLLDYNYFDNYYIDLSKQQALDADPKVIQQINFTGNLDWAEGATMFFIIEEAKEIVLDFLQETVNVLRICSKTQLHKIGQSGRFLGRLLGPLLKSDYL